VALTNDAEELELIRIYHSRPHTEAEKALLLSKSMSEIFAHTMDTPAFKKAVKLANAECEILRDEWTQNAARVSHLFGKITKFESIENPIHGAANAANLSHYVDIHIIPSTARSGSAHPRGNGIGTIMWGIHKKANFPNYSLIYYCHELLHLVLRHDVRGNINNDNTHAMIELAIDNEMRIQFNEVTQWDCSEGHPRLAELRAKFAPMWREWTANQSSTGETFLDLARRVF
jgi:hypothetical protein